MFRCLMTFAWSLLIPIVAAVLLWRSVPSVFCPCNVIQPNGVQPLHATHTHTHKLEDKQMDKQEDKQVCNEH